MKQKNAPTTIEIEHWEAFINTFVPHERRERWSTKVRMGYGHWGDLPMADFVAYGAGKLNVTIEDVAGKELSGRFSEFKIAPSHLCLVLNTGRGGSAGSKALSLAEALSEEHWMLEGLISIVPGKLALLLDHEGSLLLCVASVAKSANKHSS